MWSIKTKLSNLNRNQYKIVYENARLLYALSKLFKSITYYVNFHNIKIV